MNILNDVKALHDAREEDLHAWLAARRAEAEPYITTSVDLRCSGLRLAPVDTNLFPAGFHNLSPHARLRAVRGFRDYLAAHVPSAKRVLLAVESHTRNLAYLDNIATLRGLLEQAGFEARLGNLTAADVVHLQSQSGAALEQHPLRREEGRLVTADGFVPDAVLLNNDLTSGIPPVLENIAQPVFPPPRMGWHRRRKSRHFEAYAKLADDFAAQFGVDAWRISALFHRCGMVDFRTSAGLDCLAKGVDCVIARAREKHKQYGIAEDPYVFVKADSGTYGMGIMTARSGSEMLELNKKARNKMQVIKEGTVNSEVIIQEGIPTIDLVGDSPAEPLVYLVDGVPVGGFYRVNAGRDAYNNLNAPGMTITGMCDEDERAGEHVAVRGCDFQAYGIVAALAALAAPREESERFLGKSDLCAQA